MMLPLRRQVELVTTTPAWRFVVLLYCSARDGAALTFVCFIALAIVSLSNPPSDPTQTLSNAAIADQLRSLMGHLIDAWGLTSLCVLGLRAYNVMTGRRSL